MKNQFIIENNLLFPEASVIKYICRHKKKGKLKDLEKDTDRDNFMSADEAAKYGLIDKVINTRD